MADVPPEGLKRARKPTDTTWNPDVPYPVSFVPRATGWNYTFEQRIELWKLQREESAEQFIKAQAMIPPEQRVKPPDDFSWKSPFDVLSVGEYAAGGVIKGLKTGEYESYREKVTPGEVLYPEETAPAFRTETEQFAYDVRAKKRGMQRFAVNILFDPLSWITGFGGGAKKVILSGGQKVGLTPEGVRMYTDLIKRYGGEVPEVRHIFSRMIRTDPRLYARTVQKEGIRIIGTNLELVPKQFLPWSYVRPAATTSIKIAQQGINAISSALNRQFGRTLARTQALPAKYVELKTAYDINLEAAKLNARKEIEEIAQDAQKLLGRNAGQILTDYVENPSIRPYFPQLAPIYERIETLHKNMAAIEKSQGLLSSERFNYIRHSLTQQAKVLKGLLPSARQRIAVETPFNIKRQLDDTVRAINDDYFKKHGINLFDPNAFNLVKQRYDEHLTAIKTVEFLNNIRKQFGKGAKAARQYKDYVQTNIPQLKGTFLPKDIASALENDAEVRKLMGAMGKRSNIEIAYAFTKAPLKVAETINRFWQRSVTVYFPQFHVLNYIGGKFNNYLAGNYDLKNDALIESTLRGKKVVVTSETGMKYTDEDILKIMDENGIRHQPGMMDVARGEPTYIEGFGALGRRIGMGIEDRLRGSLLIDRLKKGDSPEEATAYINKFHFDYYQQFNAVEETLSKFIAFYMWTTRNTALQAEMILKQPGKYAGLMKLMESSYESSPQGQVTEPYKPAWAQGKNMFYGGGNQSNWFGISLPSESITMLPNVISSPVNASQKLFPLWQVPIEEAMGKETFSGKNITNQPDYLMRKFFGRYIQTFDKIRDPNIPTWEKLTELTIGNVYQGTDWVAYSGVLGESSSKMVNNAIRRLNGRWHGCGF